MATRASRRQPRLEDLSPESRAKVEAARARARTPEARAEEQAIRQSYVDRPSVRELVDRGDLDPEAITAGNVRYALRLAVAALKSAREAKGLSLADVAQRSGIDRAALSRLENEHNVNPKLETLGRYAGALGLELTIAIDDPAR
ncbi:helix-turn-helix transcriptional regulator [Tautonia sp. JC769]|uniref:helix-turn-helix domain-containing protein n=1 Tax=Tautonia sp. JC769 TaxID=3232135 RepID=UPI00345A9778